MSADRRPPRRLGDAFGAVIATSAPRTLLADVQRVWPAVCGDAIAANSEPVAERGGRVTIACEGGAWAQELELMGELLRDRVNAALGGERLTGLRFTADLARHR
jgi:predicted nucleic acid-binding Zn ribbon protein